MLQSKRASATLATQRNQEIFARGRTSSKEITADASDMIDPSLLTIGTDIVAEANDKKTYDAKIEKIRTNENNELE